MAASDQSIEERFRITGEEVSGLLWRGSTDRSRGLRGRLFGWIGITWLPLLLITLVEGSASGSSVGLAFLHDSMPLARLLVALPLFLAVEPFIDRRTTAAIRYLETSALVPAEDRGRWQASLARISRRGDSRRSGVVLAVAALALSWLTLSQLAESERALGIESTWFWSPTADGEEPTWAGLWYVLVSTSIYRFFAFRWIWRLALWVGLLWHLARIPLRLQATHPDAAGGLAFLWRAQAAFLVVGVGFGAALSGSLASQILLAGQSVAAQYPIVGGFVAGALVVVFVPLLLFTGQLVRTRERGMVEYASLGADLSGEFRETWISRPPGESEDRIIDSVHPSSVADYGALYGAVKDMAILPFSPRGLATAVCVLVAPFAPLLLLEMPLKELLKQLLGMLV